MRQARTFIRHKHESSISRQIVLLLLAFAVLPTMALTGLAYVIDVSLHKRETVQIQSEVAGRVAQTVAFHVQNNVGSLKLLASFFELSEWDHSKIKTYLSNFIFQQADLDAVALADVGGMSAVRISRLRTYHGDDKEWLGGEPGFQLALEGQAGLGGVQTSPLSRFPQLRLYIPVKGKLDRVAGVICADMNISNMWRIVSKSFTGEDITAYIVDKNGFVIAADDISAVLEHRNLRNLEVVARFLAGEYGVFEYVGIRGESVAGVVVEAPLTGWGVVVETPARMAYRHSRLLWWSLGPMSLCIILFAGTCGWLFSARKILRPIRVLQKDVQIIATGDLNHRITLERSDELGKLANDLSLMTENLRSLTVSREMLIEENQERRKTEAALRENERRLSDILDFLPDATLAIDNEKRVIIWNRAIEEMTGTPSEAMIGQGDYAYTVPFYGERRAQLMDLIWSSDRELASKYPNIRQEGHSFVAEVFCPALYNGKGAWVFLKASPLHDQKGDIVGAIESIRDITDRKRTEEALEKRLIALTLPLDVEGNIEFEELFNLDQIQKLQDQFALATGVASIITRTDGFPITKPSNFCDLCESLIRNTRKGRENCHYSDSVIGRHNPEGPIVQLCLSGGLWDAGASISVGGRHIANWLIGQVRDGAKDESRLREYAREIGVDEANFMEAYSRVACMSEEKLKKIAQALFTLAEQLSSMAYQNIQQARFISDLKRAQEEKEKLQIQLLQSQRMESVGRLAGGVAHDFNNMLGVIIGHAEIALEQVELAQPIYNDLLEIHKAAQRSANLTRQLLGFARKQTVKPRVLDVNETVESMLKMLRRLIGEDIDLLWKPGLDLWPLKMDPSQIDQILANLCVNARDAISGVGKVTIETANYAFDEAYCSQHPGFICGEYVLIAISDDGCGMDKETLNNLFEPFYTTKGLGKGTGLGLATVYGIVKQNNGFINVYSEPGWGATFKIYLPRSGDRVSEAREHVTEEKLLRGSETILLVEDEESILDLGKTILERLGYQVLAAHSPIEALDWAERHLSPIHLLITDVVMPGMNGKYLKEKLNALHPEMKSIFMSGYTANVIAHHGVLDEGIHFLQKPFSVKLLAEKVRGVLDS